MLPPSSVRLTCDICKHAFDVTEGAAATGEIDCPKCQKPVTIGKPRDDAIEVSSGEFNDFFEVEATTGGFDVSAADPMAPPTAPPKVAAPPPPPAAPKPVIPKPSAPTTPPVKPPVTDDKLMGDFGDFDALFQEAGGAPPPLGVPATPKPPPAPPPRVAAPPSPPPPPAAPKPSPPAAPSADAADLEQLFGDFVSNSPQPAAPPPKASPAAPPSPSTQDEASKPDQELEDLFSEVSVSEASAPGESTKAHEEDLLEPGLGLEYKQRRKIPKWLLITAPSVVLGLALVAVGMARFTSIGFFGWKFGQRAADGYEAPSSSMIKKLSQRYEMASRVMAGDTTEDYRKAISDFKDILKTDPRNSPTDARLAEAMLLMGGNVVDPTQRGEVDRLLAQSEKFHPGATEAVRARGRASLGTGDTAKAESSARNALSGKSNDPEALTLLGEVAMSRADWETAAQHFTRALEADANAARAKRMLALVRVQQGKIDEAEAFLRSLTNHTGAAIELFHILATRDGKVAEARQGLDELVVKKGAQLSNAELGMALRYLAEMAESAGDIAGALASMEKAVGKDSLNHANGFYLGRLYLDRKQFDKAAEQFGRASSLSPKSAEYLIFRGWALREQAKADEALSELTKGLELATNHVLGLYQLGLTQRDLNRSDEAVASLENVLKNDSRHVEAMVVLGELYLKKDDFAMSKTHLRTAIGIAPKSARAHNALGEVFLTAGDAETALKEFKTAEAEDPQYVTVLANIGKAYLVLGKIDLASTYFQRALALDSTRIETQVALGELQHTKKEYTKALETYRKVLEMRPKDFDTRVKLAKVLIDQQSYQDSVNELLEAAKYNPNFYPTRLNLGIAWRGLGNLDSSLEELAKATQIRPEAADGHYQTEMTYIFRNDPMKAAASMEKSINLDVKFIDPLVALGDFFDSKSLYAEAAQYYTRAEKIEPKNVRVLLKLAEANRREGKNVVARKYYQKVVSIDRKNADSYVALGLLAEDENRSGEAVRYYKQAQSVDPDDPRPYYYLGFLYKNSNQRNAALLAFRKYLRLDPQSKERKDIEDEIETLGK